MTGRSLEYRLVFRIVKIVADEHIPFPSILFLRENGVDVLSIREEYRGLDDEPILAVAKGQDRVLMTCDSDFGNLIFNKNVHFSSGVIYFRLGHFRPDELGKLLLHYLSNEGIDFEGRFTVISRNKFRQRKL